MAKAILCPSCGGEWTYPGFRCASGCVPIAEFSFAEKGDRGFVAASGAAKELGLIVESLQGTPEYLASIRQGESSTKFQALVQPTLERLGFQAEVRSKSGEAGFRPDFVLPIPAGSGVMVEVERGKTIDNNMDMLDMWKCHVLPGVSHLILMVPVWYVKHTKSRSTGVEKLSVLPTYAKVCVRLGRFFDVENRTNVRSLHVIGY